MRVKILKYYTMRLPIYMQKLKNNPLLTVYWIASIAVRAFASVTTLVAVKSGRTSQITMWPSQSRRA